MLERLFLFICLLSFSYALEPFSPSNMDFTNWDTVVKHLVKQDDTIEGIKLNSFNYSGLVDNKPFEDFTIQVENAVNLDRLSHTQYKAFWINVYNYLAVRLVLTHPCAEDVFGDCRPLHSIREVGTQQPSLLTSVWDLPALQIKSLNKTLSLNDVEDGLRNPPNKWQEDARIHAAIVCASVSCPNLRNRAYTVENLDEELTQNVQDFLSNDKKGVVIEGDSLRVSAIFSFFPEDFNQTAKNSTNSISIPWFLSTYGPAAVKEFIAKNPNPPLLYFTYNWDLNGNTDALCGADRLCFPWWAFIVLAVSVVASGALLLVIYNKRKRRTYQAVN